MSSELSREEKEKEASTRTPSQREPGDRADTPRQIQPGALGGLGRVLRLAGNAAISRLLGHERAGRPLHPETRSRTEQGLHANFENVRVHDDPESQQVTGAVDARAVTRGEDIYLAKDAPSPDSEEGRDLIAHELAHVVQQREADRVDLDRVSEPGDHSERLAEAAAQNVTQGQSANVSIGGAVAGTQRQKGDVGASRAEVEAALTQFLQRALQAQGGQNLRVTDEIRNAVMMLAHAPDPGHHGPGDDAQRISRQASLQAWLSGVALPGSPQEFARQVALRLPDPFDRATLERLTKVAAGPESTRGGRLGELVERSAPGEPEKTGEPKQPTSTERFDQFMKDWRRQTGQPQPTEYGPYSVDVLRLGRIAKGLPGAWKGPQRPATGPTARSYPEVDQAIQKIDKNALVPAQARGKDTGDYADAQEVAFDVARKLDIAQQQQQDGIVLHLPDLYNGVRDPDAILSELGQIVRTVKDALPHHASSVRYVNVFFGDRNVRLIPLNAPAR